MHFLPRDLNTVNFFSWLNGGSFFVPATISPSSANISAYHIAACIITQEILQWLTFDNIMSPDSFSAPSLVSTITHPLCIT